MKNASKCGKCGGHAHKVTTDQGVWLECTHGCGWSSHPKGLTTDQVSAENAAAFFARTTGLVGPWGER